MYRTRRPCSQAARPRADQQVRLARASLLSIMGLEVAGVVVLEQGNASPCWLPVEGPVRLADDHGVRAANSVLEFGE